MEIEVPFGCTAVIRTPFYPDPDIGGWVGPTDITCRRKICAVHEDDVRGICSNEAVKAIERVSPLLSISWERACEDFLYESLDSLSTFHIWVFSPEITLKAA